MFRFLLQPFNAHTHTETNISEINCRQNCDFLSSLLTLKVKHPAVVQIAKRLREFVLIICSKNGRPQMILNELTDCQLPRLSPPPPPPNRVVHNVAFSTHTHTRIRLLSGLQVRETSGQTVISSAVDIFSPKPPSRPPLFFPCSYLLLNRFTFLADSSSSVPGYYPCELLLNGL